MSDIREDGSEIIHYDDSDFPVFCRHNYIPAGYPLRKYTPNHYHEEVEIVFIEKGMAHHTVNGDYITLHEGEGLFINARQFHELIMDDASDCTLYCLIFNPRILGNCITTEGLCSRIVDNESIEYVNISNEISWQKEFIKLLIDIVELSDKKEPNQMMGLLYLLWDKLCKNLLTDAEDKRYINLGQRMTKEMIMFIQHNYKDDISLEQICAVANVGRTKCTELFNTFVHLTPVDYLRCYRLEKSIELLEKTDMSIADIAYEVGFASSSYYGKYFKMKTGFTPLGYRKRCEEDF